MRKLLFCLFCMFFMLAIQGQVPTQLNYQGVARKANGHGISNETISVRLSIHDLTAAGPVVYRETRSVITNAFGLFNVAIGSPGATGVIGSIALVNWGTGNKFLQVELDPNGGSSFINLGTSQLLSVPYALYAGGAFPVGPAGGDLTGTYPNPTVARIRGVNVTPIVPSINNVLGFDGTNWTPTSLATHPDNYWRFLGGNIYNANGGNVGIGINIPTQKLDVNGNLKTLGFILPTGAGAGKFLMSDAIGNGSWSSTIAATSIVLPYKDSASSETAHIFHIIQTSPTSSTGALFGVTRSAGMGAFGTGGQVSSTNPGDMSAGVRGENLGVGGNGFGVYGSQAGSGVGVYGITPSGRGVSGTSNSYYGVYGTSTSNSGVFGHSNSGAGYLAGVFGYATNAGGNGTFGYANRADGFGALGVSDSSTGVYGQTNSSTYAALHNDGVAVYGIATSGGLGVYGNSFANNAARFENTNPGNSADVVLATTNTSSPGSAAVHGINGMAALINVSKKGIWGESNTGFGVYGASSSGTGVFGVANTGIGIQGLSLDGFAAVYANHSDAGYGLYSQSTNGVAGRFAVLNATNTSNVLEASTAGTGRTAFFVNTNAANSFTTLEVRSNGTGRAIFAQSEMPGPVNAGVIDALTTVYGSNALYGRATKGFGFGLLGLSDSSAGTAGVGYRAGSVGVLGQGWMGTAGQFFIDNTFTNPSNTVEVSNSQTGKGIDVNLSNAASAANAIEVTHAGSGNGIFSNSNLGVAARLQNSNASNASTTLDVRSVGTGRAIFAQSNLPGPVNAGVIDALTTVYGSNAIYGRATKGFGFGMLGISDSSAGTAGIGYRAGSVGILGQGWMGTAGQFFIDNTFTNPSNTVEVSNSQTGKGIVVDLTNPASSAMAIDVSHAGNGIGVYSNSNLGLAGRFENTNATNTSTTFEVKSLGTGRAIFAQSNLPGPVNAGVIDALTTVYGSNALYGRATKGFGFGVLGLSDSSAGTAGVGYRPGSVGILGQGWMGTAGQFFIDNTFTNPSNTVEVSNSQTGKGIDVNLSNAASTANAIDVSHAGSGIGVYSNSNLGIAARLQNTNAANGSTTLDVRSVGTGRAIFAQSNLPGPVFGGVVEGLSTVYASNTIFGRATRQLGWGVVGYSDSSVGTAGIGVRLGSVGVFGQSYSGTAAQFLIDNSSANTSNTVEVSNSQTGKGIMLNLTNSGNTANGVEVNHSGSGNGIYTNSNLGIAGRFENDNASNGSDVIVSTTNGTGRVLQGIINNAVNVRSAVRGETNGTGNGVGGLGTNENTTGAGVYGMHTGALGNGVIGWGTKQLTYGVIGHADSSVGIYGESGLGNAAYFYTYGANNTVPTLYGLNNGLSNAASFNSGNIFNTADAVIINRVGAGRSLMVNSGGFLNPMNFYDVVNSGKQTARVEGTAGLGLLAHAGGTFRHGTQRVGVGAYGQADSTGSEFNYGVVGTAKGGTTDNAGVVGWIGEGADAGSINAAILGYVQTTGVNPRYAGLFLGDVQVTGTLSKGAGTFKIDHPQDPANKFLVHSFVESPDMMNVYNGNVVTDAEGKASVDLPGYFEAENKDFKYQLTVIGQFSQAIIGEEIKNNQFVILTDKPNVKVSWQVTGVRNDRFAQVNRVVPEVEKKGTEKGKYMYPELYGHRRDEGITYMKSALPSAEQGASISKAAKSNFSENNAQEQVNNGVDQKRRMMNAQLEQTNIQTAKANAATTANKQMKMPTEKSSVLSAASNAPSQVKAEAVEEKKEIQFPTEKIRQMAASADIKQPDVAADTRVQSPKPMQTPAEKTKQLSAATQVEDVSANKNTQEAKPKAINSSSEKMKQLVSSLEISKGESIKKVEQPKTDSVIVSKEEQVMKAKSISSPVDAKKLSTPKLKLPIDPSKEVPKKN